MVERTEQELIRFNKLKALREKGFSFPNDAKVDASSVLVQAAEVSEDTAAAKRFTVAGRLVQIRMMGKAAFCHLLDGKGKLQLYVKKDIIGDGGFEEFSDFDIGDIVEAKGYAFVTKTGEKSLFVESIRLLVKSLIPLPEKWHGLTDVEARYRQRYVDLISNAESREVFRARARIIREIRAFLDKRDFLEVETAVLNYVTGGASARPFSTHFNALNTDMHLRISLELPLKKLIAGGLERVYELGRVFRNEGLSKKHNPEFTMIEFYQAYATFDDLMQLTEELFVHLVQTVRGGMKASYGGKEIDFTPPWPRLSMKDSLHELGGVDRSVNLDDLKAVHAVAETHKIHLPEKEDWGRCIEELWGELVEGKIVNPVFITHHPFSISPLARKNAANGQITDRFELIVMGMECANAFSELNDAEDQRERFEEQARRKSAGDEEANDIDEDFLRALEYGMPPTAGEGIGIDRLVMLLTDSPTIREVLLFPQMKPESADPESVTDTEAETK